MIYKVSPYKVLTMKKQITLSAFSTSKKHHL